MLCVNCGKNPGKWANGLCDPCLIAECEERATLVGFLNDQMRFMERHKDADSFIYDTDGTLTQVIYLSPIQKAKLAGQGDLFLV